MKKYNCNFLLIFFFVFTTHQIQSQENDAAVIGSKYSYAEKIYLQLSSTIFTTDNTIWFKAIVTDFVHFPTRISGVLHVEFIDFDELGSALGTKR